MDMREKIARAVYDATDPITGDPIATTLHLSELSFYTGPVEEQLKQVMEVCLAAADAVLDALREPTPEMIEARRRFNLAVCKGTLTEEFPGCDLYTTMIDAARPNT